MAVDSQQLKRQLINFCTAILLFVAPAVWADSADKLFETVPLGDTTYSQLRDLAKAGLIKAKEVEAPLTRYDVVQRILKAHQKYDGLVVAQADMEIPPPPADGQTPAAASSDELQAPGSEKVSAQAAANDDSPEGLAKAAKSLRSLDEAYQYELKAVKGRLKAVQDRAANVDADQYDLRKRIVGIEQFPTVAVHGVGRFSLMSNQYDTASSGVSLQYPGARTTNAFLDLIPVGIVGKEISWSSIFRIQSSVVSNDSPLFTVRRVSMNFNPSWLSVTVGDFDESYTPFTLWNRNNLDLAYRPETYARQDDWAKYESFLNREPDWPFRGLKLGTAVMWPDSDVMEELHGSVMIDMIRNGFNNNGGWFFGPDQYTDWIFGGTGGLKTKKWYLGGTSLQLGVDTYGVILDEPLDTQLPGSPYGQFNPATWARQYINGSVRPDLKVGLGGDFYFGGTMEYAFSSFQDDKFDNSKISKDYALIAGPYFQLGDSKLTLNALDVGPYFYSPLAQTRQDAVTASSGFSVNNPLFSNASLRGQYFLQNIPRAGGIYSFYDRTQDNTFPYGLATPNRQGFGGELDVKALKDKALKIKGSAYFVQEISGNLVINGALLKPGIGFIPVDGSAGTTIVPMRNFTYVNVGPSFNLGPFIGLDRDLEIGANTRLEQTTSVLGTLTTTWIIGSLKADVLPVWEIGASFSEQDTSGTDAGIRGSNWARYSYLFDNSDLGNYSTFTVRGSSQIMFLSSVLKVNRNSNLFLDYEWYQGNYTWNLATPTKLIDHIVELTYEVQF